MASSFTPVLIPTKKYIKAYLVAQLGVEPKMTAGSTSHEIYNKLNDLLSRPQNNKKTEFSGKYNDAIKIYISTQLYSAKGKNLNHTNVKNFNLYVEILIKFHYFREMDRFIEVFPCFNAHLPEIRKILGIDAKAWSDESMRKAYYRHRTRNGLPLLYNDKTERFVSCEEDAHSAF